MPRVPIMQTLNHQRSGGLQHSSSSADSYPPHLPSAPYSSTTAPQLPTLFGPTNPRSSRRPGTSSGSAVADGLLSHEPFGNDPPCSDPFRDDSLPFSQPSSSRRPFAFGLGSAEASNKLRRKRSNGRKPSLGDLPSNYTWEQQQQQQQQHHHQQDQRQQGHSPPPVSRFQSLRRRANSVTNLRGDVGAALGLLGGKQHATTPPKTDTGNPPALPPAFAQPAAPKLSNSSISSRDNNDTSSRPRSRSHSTSMDAGRMVSRQGTMPNGSMSAAGGLPGPGGVMSSTLGMQTESTMVHQHIQEMANKRISTLEYLRKAHEGRVYWFNTLLFDKPDLARMNYFDTRRLARRATNYLLFGLSLPTVIDLNASPLEFLRSLNLLLTEFDTFQSLHPESGNGSSALGRARIPNLNVFRRGAPSSKSRRSSSANNEVLYEDGAPVMPNGNGGGGVGGGGGGGGGGSNSNMSSSAGGGGGGGNASIMNGLGGSASVVSFGQSEADLLPGEEYVHLLTPSLPFDPDFFETFATLCDVLIDAYTRLLGMLPTPRECNAAVAELFTKADARIRKIIVQGIVKEFEDTSRNGVRTEVANVGKIVLGGLM